MANFPLELMLTSIDCGDLIGVKPKKFSIRK